MWCRTDPVLKLIRSLRVDVINLEWRKDRYDIIDSAASNFEKQIEDHFGSRTLVSETAHKSCDCLPQQEQQSNTGSSVTS